MAGAGGCAAASWGRGSPGDWVAATGFATFATRHPPRNAPRFHGSQSGTALALLGFVAHLAHARHPKQPHARSVDRADGYFRHRPEESALYQTIAEHWPAFRGRAEEAGGLPKFIVREVEDYLCCGILERGCLHLECRSCGYSQLVPPSCKRRGFCPSCLGRRMVDLAVHLEQSVLPPVPIRHWICSFPWG